MITLTTAIANVEMSILTLKLSPTTITRLSSTLTYLKDCFERGRDYDSLSPAVKKELDLLDALRKENQQHLTTCDVRLELRERTREKAQHTLDQERYYLDRGTVKTLETALRLIDQVDDTLPTQMFHNIQEFCNTAYAARDARETRALVKAQQQRRDQIMAELDCKSEPLTPVKG